MHPLDSRVPHLSGRWPGMEVRVGVDAGWLGSGRLTGGAQARVLVVGVLAVGRAVAQVLDRDADALLAGTAERLRRVAFRHVHCAGEG